MRRKTKNLAERLQTVLIYATLLIAAIITGALTGCVSVSVGPKAAQKAKGVDFDPPASPFEKLSDTHADGAWQNKSNGNSISYLSTCGDPADPSLDVASGEIFSALKDPKTISQKTTTFDGREALDSEVEGSVEGVATRVRAIVFKKNGCLYTLTLIGLERSLADDRGRFEQFAKGFHAP